MQRAYAAHNRNPAAVRQASSGGIFSAIAQQVLAEGGIVYGVAVQTHGVIAYQSAEKPEQLAPLCGSKYVFVPIADVLPEIAEQVKSGRKVLVTVSPCQAAAVRRQCGEAENLLLVDFICHGAPEQKFWNKYVSELEQEHQSPVTNVSFRKKQDGRVWQNYQIEIAFANGDTVRQSPSKNPYMRAFSRNASLRRACGSCIAKGENRASDLTLGDFWGVNKVEPKAFHPAGTSLVFTNAAKGEELLRGLSEQLVLSETDPKQAVAYNPSAVAPAVLHPQWEQFQGDSKQLTVTQLADKYCRISAKEKLRAGVAGMLRRLRRI